MRSPHAKGLGQRREVRWTSRNAMPSSTPPAKMKPCWGAVDGVVGVAQVIDERHQQGHLEQHRQHHQAECPPSGPLALADD